MQLKLNIEIKKLSVDDVIKTLKEYITSLGFSLNLRNSAWYMGYACALRDAGIIDSNTWFDLTDKINSKELLKLMERHARRDK